LGTPLEGEEKPPGGEDTSGGLGIFTADKKIFTAD
jgi:hypothetical protein